MRPTRTVPVIYTCGKCYVTCAVVQVKARRDDEDIKTWMHSMTLALMRDHRNKSPDCKTDAFKLVRIAVADNPDALIGGAL